MKTRRLRGKIGILFGCLVECFSVFGWHPSQGYHQDEHDFSSQDFLSDNDDINNVAQYDNPKSVWYYRLGNRWMRYYEQHQQILEEAFQQNLLNSNDPDKIVRVVKLQAKRRSFEVDLKEMRQTSVHRLHKTKRDVVRKVFAYDNTRRDRVDSAPAKPGYQLYITMMKNENEDAFLHDFNLFYEAEYNASLLPDDPSISIPSAVVASLDQAQSMMAKEESDQEHDDNNNTMNETIQQDFIQDNYALCGFTRNPDDDHQKAPSMMERPDDDEGHDDSDNSSGHIQYDDVEDNYALCDTIRNLPDGHHHEASSMMDTPEDDDGHDVDSDMNSHHIQHDFVEAKHVLCDNTRNLDDGHYHEASSLMDKQHVERHIHSDKSSYHNQHDDVVQDKDVLCETSRNPDDDHDKSPSFMLHKPDDDERHDDRDKSGNRIQQDCVDDGDVLCGTTRNLDDHPGNKFYTTLIDEYADDYETASAKTKKSIITDIIRRVEEKGKFKYPVAGTRCTWDEISDPKERQRRNRDKVRHALGLRARTKKVVLKVSEPKPPKPPKTSRSSVSKLRRKRNATANADKTEPCQEKRSKLEPCKMNELLQNQQLFLEAYMKDGLVDCDKTTDTAFVTPMGGVSWEWKQGRSTWNPYSLLNQYSLEEGYRNYTQSNMNLDCSKVLIKAAEQTYEIDLVEMKQKNIGTGNTRIIRRREL